MRFLKIIWDDIRSLNSQLPPAVKIAGLICVMALIYGAWYAGADYWGERINTRFSSRPQRGVIVLGAFISILACYVVSVVERYRKNR